MQALKQLIDTIQAHAQPIVKDRFWGYVGNGVTLTAPATESEIQDFEIEAGYSLTKNLRELYQFSNGITFTIKDNNFHIMSLAEAQKYLDVLRQYELPQLKYSFPLFDNNDSNPWLVCCIEPLNDYVIYLPHDNKMALKYRSIESLFAAMNWYIGPWLEWRPYEVNDDLSEDYAYYDGVDYDAISLDYIPSDMEQFLRLASEHFSGHKMMEISATLPQWDRVAGMNIVMTLLEESEAETFEKMLYNYDEYVARDAYARLKEFSPPQPKTKKVIQDFEAAFAKFIDDCAEALRQAGISVVYTECKGFTGTIKAETVGLNMPMFFAARKEHPDIVAYVVERTKTLIQLKK